MEQAVDPEYVTLRVHAVSISPEVLAEMATSQSRCNALGDLMRSAFMRDLMDAICAEVGHADTLAAWQEGCGIPPPCSRCLTALGDPDDPRWDYDPAKLAVS